MPHSSWYRSPVLWFGLPGLIFLLFTWVDSMSHVSTLDLTAFGRSVRFRNFNSEFSASWYSERRVSGSGKNWDIEIHPREAVPGKSWLPLPSYVTSDLSGRRPWHCLDFSYWFLILVYLGLWQLPWLWRYHRRERIRSRLTEPAQSPL